MIRATLLVYAIYFLAVLASGLVAMIFYFVVRGDIDDPW